MIRSTSETVPVAVSPQFPAPADRVVLFDVDGTLIDKDYEVTDPAIYPAMQAAQEAGWQIGLSSDTPHATMVERARQFGIDTGPLIVEKGALVAHGDWSVEPAPGIGKAFRASRERIAEHLSSQGLIVWTGNPTEMLNHDAPGQPGDGVVLVNDRRQYGMSFYMRAVTPEGLVKDAALTDQIVAEMRQFYPDFPDLDEDKNHDYGILIVNRKIITKRLGTQALMGKMGVNQIGMVGNSYADYVGSDIAIHYAVGDASQPYKEVADYVAETPLTSGAVEILNHLIDIG